MHIVPIDGDTSTRNIVAVDFASISIYVYKFTRALTPAPEGMIVHWGTRRRGECDATWSGDLSENENGWLRDAWRGENCIHTHENREESRERRG